MNIVKEACVESFKGALRAERNGADRIELCSNLAEDGLSPSLDLVNKCINNLKIPIKVMVRPRPGNFVYAKEEIKTMVSFVKKSKELGIYNFVFGILDNDDLLDIQSTKYLTSQFDNCLFTIHKAIDKCPDILSEINKIKNIKNITSILTSGGASTAIKGKEKIKEMINISKGALTIIPAGKITKENIQHIHGLLNAKEYHGKKIV